MLIRLFLVVASDYRCGIGTLSQYICPLSPSALKGVHTIDWPSGETR
jgi:hypothetical protein